MDVYGILAYGMKLEDADALLLELDEDEFERRVIESEDLQCITMSSYEFPIYIMCPYLPDMVFMTPEWEELAIDKFPEVSTEKAREQIQYWCNKWEITYRKPRWYLGELYTC